MLNISREYSHNLNTAVVFSTLYQQTRLRLQWILLWEWDLRAIPFGVLFCCLLICHKSSLLCSWSLHPRLPSPGGNTIRCRGHFIQCHCLSTAVIRKKKKKKRQRCPSGENRGLLGNIKNRGSRRRETEKKIAGRRAQRREKISRIAVRGDTSLASDEWQYWAKYVLQTKALSPSWAFSMNYTSPPPTPSFLIKWLQLHLSIRSSPLQRLDKGLLSVAC